MQDTFFRDKVYIVTGGGRGIGRGIVEDLAQRGIRQIIVLEHNPDLRANLPDPVTFVEGDVAAPGDCQKAVDAARSWERLDGLCLVAGIEPEASRGPFWKVAPEVVRRTIDIDILGHYYMTQAAVPFILDCIQETRVQAEASIVCISSMQAISPAPQTLPHVTGKAGILGFAKGATLELAPLGIRINTILPGTIMTEAVEASLDIQGGRAANAKAHPRGIQGSIEEVVSAVRFFLGPDSRNCYGAELTVDGGLSIPGAHGLVVQKF